MPGCGPILAAILPLRPAHGQRQAAQLALAALMRKVLVTLNAMMKAKTEWSDPRQR